MKDFHLKPSNFSLIILCFYLSACDLQTLSRGSNHSDTGQNALTSDRQFVIPPSISLKTPSESISLNSTPTFTISNVENGFTVQLFSDDCTTSVASGIASGNTIELTSSPITKGRYQFHSRQNNNRGWISNCSEVFADYQLSGAAMVSKWQTNSHSSNISLPISSGNKYHMLVDWGDGSTKSLINSASDREVTHTYTPTGGENDEWIITILGTAEVWSFDSASTDKDNFLELKEAGDLGWIISPTGTTSTSTDTNTDTDSETEE